MTRDFQLALQAAFRDLGNRGYFAQQIWKCCSTCGMAAVPKHFADKYIFYHEQDAVRLCEADKVYLSWAGDAAVIIKAFQRHELVVEWDGDPARRIYVSAPSGYEYVHPDDRHVQVFLNPPWGASLTE